MTAITRTVNTLIEGAYKLIGVFTEDRALEGNRVTEGLEYLQEILDHFAATDTRISFGRDLTFQTVIGLREYEFYSGATLPNIDSQRMVKLLYTIIIDNDVLYPVNIQPSEYNFNNRRKLNERHRPTELWFIPVVTIESTNKEVSALIFFNEPDAVYNVEIRAKFVLSAVSLSQPLSQVPNYYHRFLKYALGRELRNHYGGSQWDNTKEKVYTELLENIINASEVDLSARGGSALKKRGYPTYSDFLNGC